MGFRPLCQLSLTLFLSTKGHYQFNIWPHSISVIYQFRSRIKWPRFLLQEFGGKDRLTRVEIVMTIDRMPTEKRTTYKLIGDLP